MEPARWTVLIVDDEPHSQRFFATVAARSGFAVRVAASAGEAWTLLQPPPALILLDLDMPDTDGIEMLRTLAGRGVASEIRILSGSSSAVLRSAARLGRELGLRVGEPLAKGAPLERLQAMFAEVAASAGLAAAVPPAVSPAGPELSREDLARGLEAGEIFVVFQPIVHLESLDPVGAEALVRWRHPERGIVSPGRFVPLAERTGLVLPMTEQVFAQALAFASRPEYAWEGRPLAVSVNLATTALAEGDLLRRLLAWLAASGVVPGRLVVEVTESAMNADRTRVLELLSRLRLRGVELSIDDFGTGTSSLERLDQFPLNELKIERAFVADLLVRREAEAIVHSTLELAHRLGLRTVGEGIEETGTWRWLQRAGCDTGQGFLFSRGLEAADFLVWLENWPERRRELYAACAD